MCLAGFNVQVDDQVRRRERPDEPGKEASPRKSVHPAERKLAVEMPVHNHQAVEFPGAAVGIQDIEGAYGSFNDIRGPCGQLHAEPVAEQGHPAAAGVVAEETGVGPRLAGGHDGGLGRRRLSRAVNSREYDQQKSWLL